MNKEEILNKYLDIERGEHCNIRMNNDETFLAAMEEYSQHQCAEKDARIKELEVEVKEWKSIVQQNNLGGG